MSDRTFLDQRRWSMVQCFDDRADAIEFARKYRRSNAFGPGRAFRVKRSGNSGKYCVEHASGLSAQERAHGAHYNRRMIEDENKQRRLGL